jgi:hypothetical protein
MVVSIFTASDVLAADAQEPADPYAAQLLHSYHALYKTILREEHRVRQFTRQEYQRISSFQAGHNGNPLGFALRAALRQDANEELSFCAPLHTVHILVGDFDEHSGVFRRAPWNPLADFGLRALYHDHRATRHWSFRIPWDYEYSLVFQRREEGQLRSVVMYQPHMWRNTLLPGVFFPYDLTYEQDISLKPFSQQDVLLKKRRQESKGSLLTLGSFVQFALECFPVLCPTYQVPSSSEEREHLLELCLRACYGKRFYGNPTTFQVEGEEGTRHALPQWAQRWMVLWRDLPAEMRFGKEEVLAMLDCL